MEKGNKTDIKNNKNIKKENYKRKSMITKIVLVLICIIAIIVIIKFVPKKINNFSNDKKQVEDKIDFNIYLDKKFDKNTRLEMVQKETDKRQQKISKLNDERADIQMQIDQYENKTYSISSNNNNKGNENNEKIDELTNKLFTKDEEISTQRNILVKLNEIYNVILEENITDLDDQSKK